MDIILKIILIILAIPMIIFSIYMVAGMISGLSHYWKKDLHYHGKKFKN